MSKADNNEAFVREFQTRFGLVADGWAGPATREKLYDLAPPRMKIAGGKLENPGAFFSALRKSFGSLSHGQVEGFEAVTSALAGWPITWAAYALATTWHETAFSMKPIKELGSHAYLDKYDTGKLAANLGNTPENDDDGQKYAGRGYVQITGRRNYQRFGIADTPDDALNPDVAARILREGMEQGVFTGKSLSDYLPGDYVNARRIINGTDRADEIAMYAAHMERALDEGGWA